MPTHAHMRIWRVRGARGGWTAHARAPRVYTVYARNIGRLVSTRIFRLGVRRQIRLGVRRLKFGSAFGG
jgi:hypothetical protein